ncbi:helicase-related protein, partial [Glutamicibacter creatinolyticus]|uniref:helicase-related protein n=1 Tax=Glutamicibacter creatinolyticus TaxID=162496 RepID=UPI003B983AE8
LRTLVARNRRLPRYEILPLFARLSLAEQHKVFHPGPTPRLILATNVAETSLTVPGIKYVIDTGTARISRYSHRTKVQRLPIERVSQASANQRSGRCGRVSEGIAIRLYSQQDYEARPEFTDPEIRRTNLASVILQMISLGVVGSAGQVASFPFVQPPEMRAITDGVNLLRELGALSSDKAAQVTDVGRQLAQLPLDVRLGRMIVEG